MLLTMNKTTITTALQMNDECLDYLYMLIPIAVFGYCIGEWSHFSGDKFKALLCIVLFGRVRQ